MRAGFSRKACRGPIAKIISNRLWNGAVSAAAFTDVDRAPEVTKPPLSLQMPRDAYRRSSSCDSRPGYELEFECRTARVQSLWQEFLDGTPVLVASLGALRLDRGHRHRFFEYNSSSRKKNFVLATSNACSGIARINNELRGID